MAAYRQVDDLQPLTACTPRSASSPMLGIEYEKPLHLPFVTVFNFFLFRLSCLRCSLRSNVVTVVTHCSVQDGTKKSVHWPL